jgi:hypothetical protein
MRILLVGGLVSWFGGAVRDTSNDPAHLGVKRTMPLIIAAIRTVHNWCQQMDKMGTTTSFAFYVTEADFERRSW